MAGSRVWYDFKVTSLDWMLAAQYSQNRMARVYKQTLEVHMIPYVEYDHLCQCTVDTSFCHLCIIIRVSSLPESSLFFYLFHIFTVNLSSLYFVFLRGEACSLQTNSF